MAYINVNAENIDSEHICCALSKSKNEAGEVAKKAWMKERFDEGLRFVKLDERGKVFIEYMPAENAWKPVIAPNHFLINCLWVSGRFKGDGHAAELLNICIEDAKSEGKDGIVVVSAKKDKPFLTDSKFFLHHGFEICDEASPYFMLLRKDISGKGETPRFKPQVKQTEFPGHEEVTFYFSHQCPFNKVWVQNYADLAEEMGFKTKIIEFMSAADAQESPAAFGTFGLFARNRFLTHQLMTLAQFEALLKKELIEK